jgi:hypothetical protein
MGGLNVARAVQCQKPESGRQIVDRSIEIGVLQVEFQEAFREVVYGSVEVWSKAEMRQRNGEMIGSPVEISSNRQVSQTEWKVVDRVIAEMRV